MIFLGCAWCHDTTLQLMDTMPDRAAMDQHSTGRAERAGRSRHREVLRAQDRAAMACGSASGGGSRDDRFRFARDWRRRFATKVREELDWVADVLVHVEPHLMRDNFGQPAWKIVKSRGCWPKPADLMEIAGEDGFRIRSYRNAASAIEGYPERIEDILSQPRAQGHRYSRGSAKASRRRWRKSASADRSRNAMRCSQQLSAHAARAAADPGTRAEGHRAAVSNTTKSRPSMTWSAFARNRSCASCRAWGRSSKRKCCGPSRSTASARAGSC